MAGAVRTIWSCLRQVAIHVDSITIYYKDILADMSHKHLERTCLNIETLHLFVQKSMIHPKTHIGGTGIGLVLQFKKGMLKVWGGGC